jgi:hypothetical protein
VWSRPSGRGVALGWRRPGSCSHPCPPGWQFVRGLAALLLVGTVAAFADPGVGHELCPHGRTSRAQILDHPTLMKKVRDVFRLNLSSKSPAPKGR